MTENKGDLISRSELRKAVNDFFDNHFKGLVPNELITYAEAVDNFIDNAPTVELQIGGMVNGVIIPITRPQGEWIARHKENSFGQDVVCFECNKCGEYKLPIIHTMITEPLGVCPNCGVNMQKGGAE